MLLEIVSDIAAYAKQKKVRVGIENMENRRFEFVHSIEDLNRFAEIGKDNPYFGVTIDFAHYLTYDNAMPDLSRLKLKVHNVHLSQVVEGKPHFPLTRESGIVDVNGVCKALDAYGYDGFVVFETRKEYTESKNVFEEAMTSLK